MCNLTRHVQNLRGLGLPVVVSLNHFNSDTAQEQRVILEGCQSLGVPACLCTAWGDGGAGALELAEAVASAARDTQPNFIYNESLPIHDKVDTLVRNWYKGAAVEYSPAAQAEIEALEANGFAGLPICMAKTQYSVTDDAKAIGAPEGFTIKVKAVRLLAGAGFIVIQSGNIMTMPGLPKQPAAELIDFDDEGNIVGLF
jgi:formate--tetrahydrofolate ligase